MSEDNLVAKEDIAQKIYTFRNTKVMIDSDLAKLYGINVSALNQAVKRNKDRFPKDFMFQLTPKEFEILISQIAISSLDDPSNLSVKTSDNANCSISQFVISNKNSKILKSQFVISSSGWGGKRTTRLFLQNKV